MKKEMTDEEIAERLGMPLYWARTHRAAGRRCIESLETDEAITKFVEQLPEAQRQRALSLIHITMENNGGKLPNLNQIKLRTQ